MGKESNTTPGFFLPVHIAPFISLWSYIPQILAPPLGLIIGDLVYKVSSPARKTGKFITEVISTGNRVADMETNFIYAAHNLSKSVTFTFTGHVISMRII